MKTTALLLLLISSTNAFLRAPANNGVIASSRRGNNFIEQPRCAVPSKKRCKYVDGLHATIDNVVGIRGGGDEKPPSIITKSKAFMSKNFFLIGMAVAVSFAKLFPQVSSEMFCLHHLSTAILQYDQVYTMSFRSHNMNYDCYSIDAAWEEW